MKRGKVRSADGVWIIARLQGPGLVDRTELNKMKVFVFSLLELFSSKGLSNLRLVGGFLPLKYTSPF
jgi:hypothetical protein